MAPPSIDVLRCSAEELARYLLDYRFENDGMETTTYLLEATTTLPNADAIAAQIQQDNDNDDHDVDESSPKKTSSTTTEPPTTTTTTTTKSDGDEKKSSLVLLGQAHHSQPLELSMINPRGKFNVTLHEGGIHARTVKNPLDMIIPEGSVRNIIVFPKPNDCQSTTSSKKKASAAESGGSRPSAPSPMMLLCFHTNEETSTGSDEERSNDDNKHSTTTTKAVTFKGKPLIQVCFPVPTSLVEGLQQADDDDEEGDLVHVWIRLVCRSLKLNPKTSVYSIRNPNPAFQNNHNNKPMVGASSFSFRSHSEAGTSTTSDGMPFVKCYYGVQDGCLFPMKEGLLFFKPPLFIPRSNLHSIACGRGTGSSSRYVDMNIQTHDETAVEFTNIERQEMGVLNNYIHHVLIPAMQKDAHQNECKDNNVNNDDETNTDDDEVVVEAQAAAAGDDDDDDDDEAVAEVEVDDDDSDEVQVVQVKAGRGCRSKRRAAFEAIQQTKQHYLQNNAMDDDDDDDDDDEDDPYTFQPAHDEYDQSDDDDGDVVSEEEEGEDRGEAMDDEGEVASDETEEDEEGDEEEVSPPKGKRRRR